MLVSSSVICCWRTQVSPRRRVSFLTFQLWLLILFNLEREKQIEKAQNAYQEYGRYVCWMLNFEGWCNTGIKKLCCFWELKLCFSMTNCVIESLEESRWVCMEVFRENGKITSVCLILCHGCLEFHVVLSKRLTEYYWMRLSYIPARFLSSYWSI